MEKNEMKRKQWVAYLCYLKEWAENHAGDEFYSMTPACFYEWLENEWMEDAETEPTTATLTVKSPRGEFCNEDTDCVLLDSFNAYCNYFGESLECANTQDGDNGPAYYKKCAKCLASE
jgi:hypothetical protein